MMGRPVLLVDNLFNPRIYSGHTLAASSTAAGTDVLNLSAGRRLSGIDLGGWFADDLNADGHVTATFNRPREFDLLAIGPVHNLAGESLSVRISDDGFTTTQEIGPLTVPSAPTPFSHLYDGQIIWTDEGMLLWWLGAQIGWEARVFIAAMGAGIRPEMAWMTLGKSFVPGHAQVKPMDYGKPDLMRLEPRSPRRGELHIRAESMEEYATARYPLEDLYVLGRHGMVLLHNDEEAERAAFNFAPDGQAGFEIPQDRYLPEMRIPYEESEAALI